MRFLIYILIIVVSATFFVYRQETTNQPEPISPISTPLPLSDPLTISTEATSTPLSPVSPISPILTKPKLQPVLDQKAIDLIQQKINEVSSIPLSPISPVLTPPPPRLSQPVLYDKASSRVVNFFCEYANGVETASGVIISPNGYILTNAHVAEAFVTDKNYECRIRQGSPAKNIGYAKIVMFPSVYVGAPKNWDGHANDVSIWKMTRSAGGEPIANDFPYYSIDTNFLPKKDQILATFSYPGELLGYEVLLKSFNMLFGETIVSEFNADFIVSGMSLSSQSGSSGGILVDIYTNKFAGLIFGVTTTANINERKLFSLSPYAVERVVKTETGLSLADFLNN
ncbi:MAG: trypsin-like peptidase domain-containing protein [bacterium]|nr:trypsin-like peptidase domain-containing protein [bacterium]